MSEDLILDNGSDQLGVGMGTPIGTSNVFKKMFDEQIARDERARATIHDQKSELDEIAMQAEANSAAFVTNVRKSNEANQDVFQKLEQTRALGPVGRILGLFDSDYNEKSLVTRGTANAQAIAGAKNEFDATNSLVQQRAQTIQRHVVDAKTEADLGRESLNTMLTGLNTMLNLKKDEQQTAVSMLMTRPTAELDKMLETANKTGKPIIIGGKPFAPEAVFQASAKKKQLNGSLIKLNQSIALGNEQLDAAGRKNHNDMLDDVARNFPIASLQSLQIDPNGRAAIPGEDGKTMIVIPAQDFITRVMKHNAEATPYREASAKAQVAASQITGEFDAAMGQTDRLLRLTSTNPNEPDPNKLNSTNPLTAKLSGTMSAAAQRRDQFHQASQEKILSPQTVQLFFDPNARATSEAIVNSLKVGNKELLDSMKSGRSAEEGKAIDAIYADGAIKSVDTAVNVFAQVAISSSALTGNYADIGYKIAPAIRDLVNQQPNLMSTDGKTASDPKAFVNALMLGTQGKKSQTPEAKFAVANKAVSGTDPGTADGLANAAVGADLDYLTRNSVNEFVKQIKKSGGDSPLSSLITPSGDWSPEMRMKIQATGSTQKALYSVVLNSDAKQIAEGKLTINDNTLDRLNSFMLDRIRGGQLKLGQPGDIGSYALRTLAYGDQIPEQRLVPIIGRNAANVPTMLMQAISDYQKLAASAGAGANVLGGDIPGNTMIPANLMQPTPGNLQVQMSDYYKRKTGLGKLP